MHILLTGATGLLGRYLLYELLVRHVPVAVLVRGQRMAAAADRVETILARWERLLGRFLPRPVIVEGGLDGSGMQISDGDRRWLAANCSRVLHSAASLKFVADEETGEPWKSNVEATTGMLAECERLGIREFHAVSTAYVAGQRTGRVLETEGDVGQAFGNVYEESKCEAERRLRAAPHLDSLTIYRPSIIVGDSRTGYSSTYHGFYTPLRVASEALRVLEQGRAAGLRFLELLGLRGDERKDLVPVDWVAAAIAKLLSSPSCLGQTYHLTATRPVTVAMIHDVFEQALATRPATATRRGLASAPESTSLIEHWQAARRQMDVYRSYWRDDPLFDRTNTERALADLPCPLLDETTLAMLAGAALRDNFGWPAAPVVPARRDIRQHLEACVTRLSAGGVPTGKAPLADSGKQPPAGSKGTAIGFEITGPGGLSWHVSLADGRAWVSSLGKPAAGPATVVFRTTSVVFDRLRSGELSIGAAIDTGRVAVFPGHGLGGEAWLPWLEFFVGPMEPG